MPRKKKVIDDSITLENSNGIDGASLRRSRRKTVKQNLDQKTDADISTTEGSNVVKGAILQGSKHKPVNKKKGNQNPKVEEDILMLKPEHIIKTPKNSIKKLKSDGEISSPESGQTSPDSADSGIGSGPSLKDGCSSSTASKTPTETDSFSLETSCNAPSVDKKTQIKKSSEKPKQQRTRKRKADDLAGISISPNKKTKSFTKKNLSSKNKTTDFENQTESKLLLESNKKENLCLEEKNSVVDNAACSSSTEEKTVLQILAQHEFDGYSDSKNLKTETCDKYSSSESDWEEVEERKEVRLEDYNPVIPKEGVEIIIDCPELNVRKRKKKQFDHMEYIRLYINRERKEHQLNVHKTHLLCLLAHGLFVNDILNSPSLRAFALSYVPSEILAETAGRKIDKANSDVIHHVVSWFRKTFSFENKQLPFLDFGKNIPTYFEKRKSLSSSEYNLMFIVFARTLGFKTRFCISFYPVDFKAKNLLKKPGSTKKVSHSELNSEKEGDIKITKSIPIVQGISKKKSTVVAKEKTKSDVTLKKKTVRSQRSSSKSYKMSSEEDEDFVEKTPKKIKQEKKISKKMSEKLSNRKVLSSDSEPDSSKPCSITKDKIICWCEVFSKPDKQWISIECCNNITDKPYDIEKLLPQPVTYILAYDNDSFIKDLTRRYCSEYMTSTLKLRADSDWWEETLEYFAPPNSKLNKEEEKKLDEILINKPLPKTIGEFKNHPLYALKRHLLKFEAIYPPDAAPVGFMREEPVYARDNVCKLHSRETWVKEARVVRVGEEPYKIVKARPKWDRIAGVMRTDLPLEVFGFWQTQQYEPPVAEGGKVPRNEYGNVELFKACMLPRGTVHLQIPGLNRVAKKLGIDCSPAVVGFDGHKGSIHPVALISNSKRFDGFVVCKEFKDTLLAAWDEDQENARKREEEKREKRIYGNWKKLIKGLLIRERIKLKYDVK